jgi:apolipoprotein N-acyltransferase
MILFLLSYFIVAFGQPASSYCLSLLAATIGYASFFYQLLDKKNKFFLGTLWYTLVEWTWLIWFISHPYYYIYFVHLGLSFLAGLQFGLLSTFVSRERVQRVSGVLFLAGFWTLMEWLRHFFLAGFFFNPAGLALTASLTTLQFASLGGVLFLSFWVLLTNLLFLRSALLNKYFLSPFFAFSLPIFFGIAQIAYQQDFVDKSQRFNALLVQTAFNPEEEGKIKGEKAFKAFVLKEWGEIFSTLKPHTDKKIDLIAMPEGTVAFGTYAFVFPYEELKNLFITSFGEKGKKALMPLEFPLARFYEGEWLVSNGYIGKSLANCFQCEVILGLEDAETDPKTNERLYFTSAQVFSPFRNTPIRYDKRVLVPMGEYIPFSFCASFAKAYGISSSYQHGKEVKVIPHEKTPFGLSICYEEMYGNLMRQNRIKGANLLVNITNDAWYPHSSLPKQHYTHARLRTVEAGIPLLRSCNTGLTSATDCLGRLVGAIDGVGFEDKQEALFVSVPTAHFKTLYSFFGDGLVVSLSLILVLLEKKRLK